MMPGDVRVLDRFQVKYKIQLGNKIAGCHYHVTRRQTRTFTKIYEVIDMISLQVRKIILNIDLIFCMITTLYFKINWLNRMSLILLSYLQ